MSSLGSNSRCSAVRSNSAIPLISFLLIFQNSFASIVEAAEPTAECLARSKTVLELIEASRGCSTAADCTVTSMYAGPRSIGKISRRWKRHKRTSSHAVSNPYFDVLTGPK